MADAAQDIPRLSAAEYLQMEKQATHRHEFVNGIVYAMAGTSKHHDLIAGDGYGLLLTRVAPPCSVFTGGVKVRIRAVSVSCSDLDNDPYEIAQPTLIIEVLSRSTESADRGYKFDHYRLLASLQEYVLVHQERACVEVHRRRRNWEREIFEVGAEFVLESVAVTVPVAAFYRRVRF